MEYNEDLAKKAIEYMAQREGLWCNAATIAFTNGTAAKSVHEALEAHRAHLIAETGSDQGLIRQRRDSVCWRYDPSAESSEDPGESGSPKDLARHLMTLRFLRDNIDIWFSVRELSEQFDLDGYELNRYLVNLLELKRKMMGAAADDLEHKVDGIGSWWRFVTQTEHDYDPVPEELDGLDDTEPEAVEVKTAEGKLVSDVTDELTARGRVEKHDDELYTTFEVVDEQIKKAYIAADDLLKARDTEIERLRDELFAARTELADLHSSIRTDSFPELTDVRQDAVEARYLLGRAMSQRDRLATNIADYIWGKPNRALRKALKDAIARDIKELRDNGDI